MSIGSVRKKGSEWNDIKNDGNAVICRHYNLVISKKIEIGQAHLNKCRKKKLLMMIVWKYGKVVHLHVQQLQKDMIKSMHL